MATKIRQVKFSASISTMGVKNGKTEELKVVLNAGGAEAINANIQLLKNFQNGEELTITIEPRQLDIERDAK